MQHEQQFLFEWSLITVSLASLCIYLYCAYRQRFHGRRWNLWRKASFTAGIAFMIVALLPPVASFGHHDLRGHMLQHLVLGMFAPLLLVMAAPMALLLRSLSPGSARRVVHFLQSPFITGLSHPITALLLNVGGMYVLYLTPLYQISLSNSVVHAWVHLHFIVAGCLFTWAIAGPDPGPHRPAPRFRLGVVFLSIAAHSILAKMMYAYGWPRGTGHDQVDIQVAAKLMYYGGDLAELLLVVALVVFCFPKSTDQIGLQQRKRGQIHSS